MSITRPSIPQLLIMTMLSFCLLASRRTLTQNGSHGTAAVVIWTPKRAILATDSKITHMKGEPATAACKIRPSGKFFFAMSGFYGGTGTDFDAWRIVAEAIRSSNTVPEASAASEKVVLPRLNATLDRVRAEDPLSFAAEFKETFLGLFVVGIDSGKPVAAGWQLLSSGKILRDEYPGNRRTSADDIGFNTFGEHEATDLAYPGQSIERLLRGDPVKAAQTLIQLEIDRDPTRVGPPRSVLEISSAGQNWIEPGICN